METVFKIFRIILGFMGINKLSKDLRIIQGGMGVNISSWLLARTVSKQGGLGTVSGTMLEGVLIYELQKGDPKGNIRRALSKFPFPHFAQMVLDEYFIEGGIKEGVKIKKAQMFTVNPSDLLIASCVCANFVYVYLAKEGHKNPVSINYLEKVAMPHIYNITGAMLAGVDFITMGAGLPDQIPGVIEAISKWGTPSYEIPVINRTAKYVLSFDLEKFFGEKLPQLKKPGFIPIISSITAAKILLKRCPAGSIYAFVVEEPKAGGHNAPPRNKKNREYGDEDYINYKLLAEFLIELGIPFYIGGSYASPEKLKWALSVKAKGIQAGSIFALSEESGMYYQIRNEVRKIGFNCELEVETSMTKSPTGYPFKVAKLKGTVSEEMVYLLRTRICNRGGLVSLYEKEDGNIGYMCSAEPIKNYVKKGGKEEDTDGKHCLCNFLFATAGMGFEGEPPIVTIGDDVSFLKELMFDENSSYSVKDALRYLRG